MERRIIGMHAHIHTIFFADRHDGGEKITHVLAQHITVDAFIEGQQLLEDVHRILISFFDISVDEALRLYDDCVDEIILFCFGNGLVQFCNLYQFFGGVVLFGSFASEDSKVEVSEANTVEVE